MLAKGKGRTLKSNSSLISFWYFLLIILLKSFIDSVGLSILSQRLFSKLFNLNLISNSCWSIDSNWSCFFLSGIDKNNFPIAPREILVLPGEAKEADKALIEFYSAV